MRTMLRWTVPADRGNSAIRDGSMTRIIERLVADLNPEAAYFWPEHGRRAGMMIFDMASSDQIPVIAEPLFVELEASVEFLPVMNADDLKRALAKLGS